MYGMPPAPRPIDNRPPCPLDAGPAPEDGGGIVAMYGMPPTPVDEDGGGIQPMYGMPAPVDAGGPDDDGGVQAMYGLPFPGNN
jgi:hypothetical protein